MDNNNENIEQNKVEIIDTVNVETNQATYEKAKKQSKGTGKVVIAGFLVFGMALGSALTLTTMKDSIVAEVTNNLSTSVPANASNDNTVTNTTPVSSSSNVVSTVRPSVVSIGILGPYSSDSLVGAGTGVVFDYDDENVYIVTNNHVIEGASGVKVWFDGVEDPVSASLIGTEPSSDLAVISVNRADLTALGFTNITPCEFGDSDEVLVGDSVIAIGNAMGEGISSTGGMISQKDKTISESNGAEINVIQTDASINPGNSGGPLVNSKGEVIGINTAKLMTTFNSSVEGVGYAIPSNDVVKVIDQIMEDSEKPYLGIKGFTVDEKTAQLFSLPQMGVFVKDVIPSGSADLAGIKPNDIITSFNGETVTNIETLQELIKDCEVSEKVPVIVYRNGESVKLEVEMLQQTELSFN